MGKALDNAEFAKSNADKEIPDLKDVKIPGPWLLIFPYPPEHSIKFKSGKEILLPDTTVEDLEYLNTVGKVVKMGDCAYEEENKKWVKEGDNVVYGRLAGEKLKLKGCNFILLKDTHVMMKVDDPKIMFLTTRD
jgi:co-chaperonin GroES (HSP10)